MTASTTACEFAHAPAWSYEPGQATSLARPYSTSAVGIGGTKPPAAPPSASRLSPSKGDTVPAVWPTALVAHFYREGAALVVAWVDVFLRDRYALPITGKNHLDIEPNRFSKAEMNRDIVL